nr:FadR/GntR family transcriptional regulator [Sporomusa acidovorans]
MRHSKKTMDKSSDNLYRQIVDDIKDAIREGRLQAGDVLPSERELAQYYDISRVPVREALKILEFLGAVEQVRGKGVFVKKIKMRHVLDHIDFMIEDPMLALLDLFEAREAIEIQAVHLAAERRTADDIEAMEAAVTEMKINIDMGKEVNVASVKFHNAVIESAHNLVLTKINGYLSDLLRLSRHYSLKNPGRHEVALNYHQQILQAIVKQDARSAVDLMREHLAVARKVIQTQLKS